MTRYSVTMSLCHIELGTPCGEPRLEKVPTSKPTYYLVRLKLVYSQGASNESDDVLPLCLRAESFRMLSFTVSTRKPGAHPINSRTLRPSEDLASEVYRRTAVTLGKFLSWSTGRRSTLAPSTTRCRRPGSMIELRYSTKAWAPRLTFPTLRKSLYQYWNRGPFLTEDQPY